MSTNEKTKKTILHFFTFCYILSGQ
uniref:Uncharacterized protein n=1 Tax=Anguilla anguilla TaxID=7936 RepID=A0A0E9W609_ANGAN